MVEYLFDVAKRKKCQVVFTTHSEYALKLLPPQAIWGCIDGNAYNGKLSIESLRALTGSISKNKVIFVEDDFAKDLCEEMLRQFGGEASHQIEVHKAGGYPYVVSVLEHHNKNPAVKEKAVALIDGDNGSEHDENESVVRLPDSATPEALVFGFIHDNGASVCSLIQQRCHCPTIKQDDILVHLNKVYFDTTDHHLYFGKLGEALGFLSELVVRRGLCSIFVEKNAALLQPIVNRIKEKLSC